MRKIYLKQLFAALLLLCSTVAFAGSSAPADETYTLTYVVDGETYTTVTLAAGAAINLPAGPAKEGYEFVKWDLETAVPIDIASNADAMLYTNAPCTATQYGDQFTSWQVLFDGNAGTFFHSEYANKESADGLDHYLRVDMGEGKSITNFTFTYTNRNTNSYINAPKTMVVEGSNEADGEYVELATLTNLSSTNSDVYNSQVIGNGTAYRYIRYRVTETHYNQKVYEHPFFFIAEFGMANAVVPATMPASDISLVAVYKPSGTCGESATWAVANGVLTIGGTGAMNGYDTYGDNVAPWYEYREDITTVVIEDGVTSIGIGAFHGCSGLTSVTIPGSVTSIGSSAFYNCTGLASVTIPGSVTSIGSSAFYNCTGLTSITIPNGVTSIGDQTFKYCSNLTSVAIPNSVTSIGVSAFEDCYGLTSITIPNSVTSIGSSAFDGCDGLTSVTIPGSVTSIGGIAFANCNNLESIMALATVPPTCDNFTFYGSNPVIYVPADVVASYEASEPWSNLTIKSLVSGTCGEYATWMYGGGILIICGTGAMADYNTYGDNEAPWYEYREDITTVVIEDGVTSIGKYAFWDCTALTSVTIPGSVTSIESGAFDGCDGLTSVTIPNSVTSIGDFAFSDCDGLTSVTIPGSVTSIGYSAFCNCDGLTSIVVDEENSVYDSREGCNAIIKSATNTLIQGCMNTIIPNSVTSIGDSAFCDCYGLTSIEIPNSVTSIGDYAFCNCAGLTEITIPNSVTGIGYFAFSSCTNLTSVTIPNSVTSIREWAFQECTSLTSVTIGNGVTSIGQSAFDGCDGLTSIVVDEENSVYDSREGCNAIIETATNTLIRGSGNTIIPNSVTSIGRYAFDNCNSLTNVTIPNSVTSIGGGAFYNCTGLTSVTIGNSVTTIGDFAFRSCSGLTNVTIPNSVTSIGQQAFDGCTGLTSVTIGNSVTSIGGGAFESCSALTSVTIGNSVTSIGSSAFYGCSALTSITIPNSVTSIGGSAFYNCTGLTSMEIPSSVTEVGYYAFGDCEELTDIYFASNPKIGSNAIPSTATCHLAITDSDVANFNKYNNNTYADVSYTRTISEGKYGTIMLPFVPDEASLENYAFYTLKEAGDGYIKFEQAAAPVANTPYLYTLRAGGENAAITGGQTTIAADINNCNVDGWELVGSFTNQTIDCTGGNYYAYSAARNEINRITKTLTVRPFRAYLTSTAAQNSNLRVFIGGTTGVTEISPDDIEGFGSGAVYDLYGRPVSEPAKGDIYIIDGKKVVW